MLNTESPLDLTVVASVADRLYDVTHYYKKLIRLLTYTISVTIYKQAIPDYTVLAYLIIIAASVMLRSYKDI